MKFLKISVIISILAIQSTSNSASGFLFDDDGPECKAPNGGGLQSVIDEFTKLLPVDKLLQIYLKAVSSDPEVQEAMEYLQSNDFKNLIIAIQNAPEFYDLMNYACDKLYLDAYYYYNKFAELFNLPIVTRPPPHRVFSSSRISGSTYARKGLKGMIFDLYDALPIDEIKKMFEDKLKNDEYVKLAMKFLASDDFKKMVKLVEGLKEYQVLLEKLREMDIDIDSVIAAIKKFFGWDQ